MIDAFVQTLLNISSDLGYWGVLLLMTIESSFVPFPSELVVPPAAYLASKGEMNIYLVVLFGILGSLIGALINYFLAMWLGRPLIYALTEKKWTSIFLLNSKKVEKAERYFLKYGNLSTFLGRLVPAVRQLISLPAGFSRMKLRSFLFYTFLGSGFWVSVLAFLGYFFGAKQDVFEKYYLEMSFGLIGIVCLIIFGVYLMRRRKRRAV